MSDRDRLYELLSDELDGCLTEDGRAELAARLEADPEARELRNALTSAHAALELDVEPPAELLANVMEGVERENRARRASRVRTVRIVSGFAAAAAVLAVAVLPGALRSLGGGAAEDMYSLNMASEAPGGNDAPANDSGAVSGGAQEPASCYNPAEEGAVLMAPAAPRNEALTAEEFCADYLAVLYFDRLPPELTDPDPVLFSDGTAGHIITQEQFEQYKSQAVRVEHPNPNGALIMAVAPAE